jgi:hypothetical protein
MIFTAWSSGSFVMVLKLIFIGMGQCVWIVYVIFLMPLKQRGILQAISVFRKCLQHYADGKTFDRYFRAFD